LLAGHFQNEQSDGQASEGSKRTGGRGEAVGEDDGVAGLGLDVADVAGDADAQTGQGGGPGPDALACGPAVEVGDVQGEFADGQENVNLGGPRFGLPAGEAVVGGRFVASGAFNDFVNSSWDPFNW